MKNFKKFLVEEIQSGLVKISREEIQQLFGGIATCIDDQEGCSVVFVQVIDKAVLCNGLASLAYTTVLAPAGSGMDLMFEKGLVTVGAEKNYRKGGGTTADGYNLYICVDGADIAARGFSNVTENSGRSGNGASKRRTIITNTES